VKLTLPLAVLMGMGVVGLMVSVGVYLGLRGAPRAATSTTTSASAPASITTTVPEPASTPAPTTPEPVDRSAVAAEVTKALEPQRATLLSKCWRPSVAKNPEGPDHVAYTLNFTFGPDGQQITRGIVEPSEATSPAAGATAGAGRGDVTMCVSTTIAPVAIRPRGTNVNVEVPLRLP
jgi:hypothetical protein